MRTVFSETRVSAVDDKISRAQDLRQCGDGVVGDRTGGHHHPHHPGSRQRVSQAGQVRHVGDLRTRIETDYFVAGFPQSLTHVEAHLAETDQTDLHVRPVLL